VLEGRVQRLARTQGKNLTTACCQRGFQAAAVVAVAVEAGGLVKAARELLMPGTSASLPASPARLLNPQRHDCGVKEVSV
jgi:hypothetical protein